MRALHFDGTAVRLSHQPAPAPAPGEALVRVRLAGVCATDLEILRGYRQHRGILGHEMVGEVEACAAAPGWVGRRVAGEINEACGACERCTRGHRTHCAQRRVMGILGKDGCFAEHVVLPLANLHAVPDAVPDEQAVFTEPLAAAFEILQSVAITPSDRVVVLGDGKLGLLVAMALHAHGLRPTVVGRHRRKLDLVAPLGLDTVLADAHPLGDADFDFVVECTGSPQGLADALRLVRPRGTVVLKSTFAAHPTVDMSRIVVDEVRLVGSRCGPFAVALEAMAAGRVDPRPLLEARYPIERGEEALAHAAQRGVLKVVIEPGGG